MRNTFIIAQCKIVVFLIRSYTENGCPYMTRDQGTANSYGGSSHEELKVLEKNIICTSMSKGQKR